jgi:hypothetical protein
MLLLEAAYSCHLLLLAVINQGCMLSLLLLLAALLLLLLATQWLCRQLEANRQSTIQEQ